MDNLDVTSSDSIKPYLQGKKLNAIEVNKSKKDGLDIGIEIGEFAKKGWEEINKTDLELRLKWYGIFWRPKTPGKFMLRLRVPNGVLYEKQLVIISSIVARYGESGSCDITTRQNIQIRGILISDLPEILQRLKEADLHTIQSGFDNPRNVTGNPIAGIDPKEIIDTRKYTSLLQDFLINNGDGNPEFSNLPRKWNTAVAGSEDNFLLHNDLVFHPVKKDGVMGFGIWVGGILSSQMNDYAIPLDAWIEASDICRITEVIISIWRDNGERYKRQRGRFRFYLDSIGIDRFRNLVEKKFGMLERDPGSVFSETPRSFLGIHKQKQANKYYAGVHIPVGRLSSEDLQDIATVSRKYGNGEIRLTEDQNIIFVDIESKNINGFKKDPMLKRFPIEPSPIAAGTVSCTGSKYCSFALTNTKDAALKISKELDNEIQLTNELKIHWTGCPNSCGQAYMGAIGLTGKKAKNKEGKIVEAYDISIGGSQGENNSIGKLTHKAVPIEEVKSTLKTILVEQYSAVKK